MKFYKINYVINKKFNIIKKNFILNIILENLYKKFFLKIYFTSLFDIYFINKNYKNKKYITNILVFNYKLNKFIFICSLILFLEKKKKLYNIILYYIYIIKHCLMHSQKFNHKNLKNFFIINYLK